MEQFVSDKLLDTSKLLMEHLEQKNATRKIRETRKVDSIAKGYPVFVAK